MAPSVIGQNAAAIFDLDRTLIPGASWPVFARHLEQAGLEGPPDLFALAGWNRLFELRGETWLWIQAARLAALASMGWPVKDVAAAASTAAAELAATLQPYAAGLIAEHRQQGQRLLLATAGPEPLARPLAEYLGFHAAVATGWRSAQGRYTGNLEGPILWGRAKLAAVQEWAEGEGVALRTSWAYADSYFDAPLLAAVGHPVAVNPDARLAGVAYLRRWPVRYLDVPEGVSKVGGRELQAWFRPLQRPWLVPNAHFEITDAENVPRTGAAIIVFNHRSYFDSVAVGLTLARADRPYRFLGKKEVFDAPVVGAVARLLGGIRVDRTSGSDEPLEAGHPGPGSGGGRGLGAAGHHPARPGLLRAGAQRALGGGSTGPRHSRSGHSDGPVGN